MDDNFFTVKEVALNNHCPECYSREGLQLTFKQKFVESIFHKAITKDTATILNCDVCETEIFPVRWTDDIEQVVDYQQRAFVPKSATVKFKKITWIILVTLILVIIALNVYLLMR